MFQRLGGSVHSTRRALLNWDPSCESVSYTHLDKPWDLVVHPGAGRRTGTLVGGILARFPDVGELVSAGYSEPDRPGIVHRLDRGTSGLLVVARTPRAVSSLGCLLYTSRCV